MSQLNNEQKITTLKAFIDWQRNTPIIAVKRPDNQLTPAICFDHNEADLFRMIEKTRRCFPLFHAEIADGKMWVHSSTEALCSMLDGYEDLQDSDEFKDVVNHWLNTYPKFWKHLPEPFASYWIALEQGDENTAHGIYIPDLQTLSACDDLNDVETTAKELIISKIQLCLEDGIEIPARKTLAEHQNNKDFDGMSWLRVDVKLSELAG